MLVPRVAVALIVTGLLLTSAPPADAGRAGNVRKESFRLLNEGVAAYNRGEYEEAVSKLEKCASAALSSFRAHFYLGLALHASRRYEEAIEILQIALDLDPRHLQSLIAVGDSYQKLGDLNEARAAYYRALKLRPGFPAALDGVARSYESQARIEEAVDHYRQAILSNKGYAPAYTNLGNLYMREDRMQEAVRLLEEAVTIRPDYAPGFNRLAVAYGRMKLSNQAVATVQRAIELEPGSPFHYETLGQLQLAQRYLSGAEQSFRKALDIEPTLAEARMGLAEVARRRGDYPTALDEIDQAAASTRLAPGLADRLAEYRTRVEAERARFDELETLADAGEASPEDLGDLSRILAGRGLWEQAAELAAQTPPGHERDAELAYLLFRSGRYREAQQLYRGLADETASTEHLLNEGVSLARLGDDEAAAAAFRDVLETETTNNVARLYLGNALLRLGRSDEAAEVYRTFLDADSKGEAAEQVRRILTQIVPDMVPATVDTELPLPPAPAPPEVGADAASDEETS
jgi:tetratricopeptide (TPR) repeat protein